MDFANSAAAQFQVSTGTQPYNYRFGDWITGAYAEGQRLNQETASNRAYEQANLTAARAWEEYLAKNKYQFAAEDLKKAGLNPWLAVQNGLSGSGISSSAGSGNSSAKSSLKGKTGADAVGNIVTSALKLLMIAAMAG